MVACSLLLRQDFLPLEGPLKTAECLQTDFIPSYSIQYTARNKQFIQSYQHVITEESTELNADICC